MTSAESESLLSIISLTQVVTYKRSFSLTRLSLTVFLPITQKYPHKYGHELPSLSFRRAYLWMCYMQDSSCYHPFYDVSSKFSFMFSTILVVSHLAMDRLSMVNMVEHIFSMACKSFTASRSDHRAYSGPFIASVNVVEGEPDDRPMTTGNHTVRDIYCCKCGTTLGWKYVNNILDILYFRFSQSM